MSKQLPESSIQQAFKNRRGIEQINNVNQVPVVENQQAKSKSRSKSKSKSRSREKVHNQEAGQRQDQQIPDNDQIMKIMGFSSFNTTKQKNHTKSACEGVRKNNQVKRQYRQYMYRRGGFDKKLDKM